MYFLYFFLASHRGAKTYSAGRRGTPGPSRSCRDSSYSFPPPPGPSSSSSRPWRSSFLLSQLSTPIVLIFLFPQSPSKMFLWARGCTIVHVKFRHERRRWTIVPLTKPFTQTLFYIIELRFKPKPTVDKYV
jgi:hypothetical protein